jgi:sulfite oxidase
MAAEWVSPRSNADILSTGDETWQEAQLLDDLGPWDRRLWSLPVELPPGEHQIRVRAWDTSGGTQPESPATVWNPKGYMNTAWGRMRITVASRDGINTDEVAGRA